MFSYFVIIGVFFLLLFCSTLETVRLALLRSWLASQITTYMYSTAMKIFNSQDERIFFEEKKMLEDTDYPQSKLFFLLILHEALAEGSSFSFHTADI